MSKYNLRTVEDEDQPVHKKVEEVKTYAKPDVKMRLRINSNYKLTGKFSGREYLFQGAGSVLNVDSRDVDWILGLRRQKGCCGGGGSNAIFELAGE